MRKMKAEREKIHAKVKADTVRLNGSKLELTADEETCTFLLVSEGSCTLQMGENSLLVNPGSALLLGAGDAVLSAAGAAVPELVGCRFPLSALHELRSATQRDFARLFLPGEVTVLYGPVMRAAMPEQDYPGGLYLLLILHYVEQECLAESSAAARPRNETIEQVCAYLAANYRQKFSLTEVAARFYISPYYLSRLFRRVTGQSIVDYINARRIEAAQKLLETTELSIGSVAEQTGFASAAHFRRVFRETMGVGPLQYRKSRK
jgi:AraC-like DNA-binding protein